MNDIILSAPSADVNGTVKFKYAGRETDIYSLSRRVTRTATLDGGSVTNDLGFTHSDRTFNVSAALSPDQQDLVSRLLRTYPTLMISVQEGLFLGAIEVNNVTGNVSVLQILIKEKLTS